MKTEKELIQELESIHDTKLDLILVKEKIMNRNNPLDYVENLISKLEIEETQIKWILDDE